MKKHKKLKIFIAVIFTLALCVVLIMVPHMYIPKISDALSISSHTSYQPAMVAHRGLSSLAPQNSLPAVELSVEYGYDGCEFDIHTTKDGKWVVIHDDTVDAMTDGTGKVAEFTLEEIRQLKLDSGNGIENYDELKIPTLEEVLTVAKGRCFIMCDKVGSTSEFKSIVLPLMEKVGAYDTVNFATYMSTSEADQLRNTIKSCSGNTEQVYPIVHLRNLSGARPTTWESTVNSNTSSGEIPYYRFSDLVKSSSDLSYILTKNEAEFLKIKGKSRLLIDGYSQNGKFETAEIWGKCEALGLNVIFVENAMAIQKYIAQKYFN